MSGSQVMFGGTALKTTYVSPAGLTATGTATSAQIGTVKITVQNPDPGKIASVASMNVQVGAAGKVTVQVIPATTQITAGSTFQYKTAVSGSGANTAVTWTINGIAGGNATVGTITSGGIYQAPTTIPNPNTIQVQATSLADTTATSTGTATIVNPAPVLNAVLPTTIPVGDFTLVGEWHAFCEWRRGLVRRHIPAHHLCLFDRADGDGNCEQRPGRCRLP